MDIQNIPWETIEAKLAMLGETQAWLARSLNVGTNVIANWRSRGGAPLARAVDLARALGCTTDELLLLPTSARGDKGSRPEEKRVRLIADQEASLVALFQALTLDGRRELLQFAEFLHAKERSEK
ncbi:hypothetical protein K7G19_19740 [Cupriavidus sp. DB3]|uniref:hypothetical protein n=1 Tax=Cupriavidus sp. DB3 TaxID=2873259 RepID=UPI001CF5C03E|nr:hypothetical protein [Cupriavidus sp. DB3]MCA7085825.1 hypothetical protein [Cupriavidus sp. DB3]